MKTTQLKTLLRSLYADFIQKNFEIQLNLQGHGKNCSQGARCCCYDRKIKTYQHWMIEAATRVDLKYLKDLFDETARCLFLDPDVIEFESVFGEFKKWLETTDYPDLTTFTISQTRS